CWRGSRHPCRGAGKRNGLARTTFVYICCLGTSGCLLRRPVGPPLVLTSLHGLLWRGTSRRGNSRCGFGWRRCRRAGQRNGLARTTFVDICFLGNSCCLVCSLVGP